MTDATPQKPLPPAPPQRGRDREVWVGLFVLVAIAVGLTLLFTMTDAALFRGRYIISTVVPDAGGIRRGDPVQMRGVNIGRVLRFQIAQSGVTIRLEIEGEYPIPSDSKVSLKSAGLLGGMVAEIEPGTSSTRLRNGDAIAGTAEAAIMNSAKAIADSTQVVLDRMKATLNDQTVAGIHDTVGSMQKGTAELDALAKDLRGIASEQRGELKALTASLRRASEGLEKATTRPELERSIARLDAISVEMEKASGAFSRASTSLESVIGRMDRGEGTLGKLSKDDQLYANMNNASKNLAVLLEDLRKNPKRYVKLSLF
jgi:phospholipid/cholesterol/gamma-HCH transport system substrate-binding protein